MNKRKLLYIIPIIGIIFAIKDLYYLKTSSFDPMVILSGIIQGITTGLIFVELFIR